MSAIKIYTKEKGMFAKGKESLLLKPLKVGNLTFKNRIMFPPLTTGYEERDGSIGDRSLCKITS